MSKEAIALANEYGGIWSEHHKYLPDQWISEVKNESTRSSYWDWVLAQLDQEE